jgi:hypothetical protein
MIFPCLGSGPVMRINSGQIYLEGQIEAFRWPKGKGLQMDTQNVHPRREVQTAWGNWCPNKNKSHLKLSVSRTLKVHHVTELTLKFASLDVASRRGFDAPYKAKGNKKRKSMFL